MYTCLTDSKQEAGLALHPWKWTLDWTSLPLGNQARLAGSSRTNLAWEIHWSKWSKWRIFPATDDGRGSVIWRSLDPGPEAKTILAAELVPAFVKYGNGKGHPANIFAWPNMADQNPPYVHSTVCVYIYIFIFIHIMFLNSIQYIWNI